MELLEALGKLYVEKNFQLKPSKTENDQSLSAFKGSQ
jgi:hypothetical protein